jgi:hypothetical protein
MSDYAAQREHHSHAWAVQFSGRGEVRVIERLKPRRVHVVNANHYDRSREHER